MLLMSKLTFGQIINGGFEVWDTTYTACYAPVLNNDFGVSHTGGSLQKWYYLQEFACGAARTTDSYNGNYALLMYNWYNYDYGRVYYSDTINFRPQYLQGYYKYDVGEIDSLPQGPLNILLTKFNGTTNDTIAIGNFHFDTISVYTPFQVEINYFSSLTPDSIFISIINSKNPCSWPNVVCNLLYLDDLKLSNTPLGIKDINSYDAQLKVYPNPFSTKITLQSNKVFQNATLEVYNLYGQRVRQIKNIYGHSIILYRKNLSNGLYFVRLIQGHRTIGTKKIMITN